MSSPTARTLARLRELGYRADVVERRLTEVVWCTFTPAGSPGPSGPF